MFISQLFIALPLFLTTAQAQAEYQTHTRTAQGCSAPIGHPERFIIRLCDQFRFANGDRITISGVPDRTSLRFTNASRNNSDYFLPITRDNATTEVVGDIDLILRNQQRHALVYRLNYTTTSGERGFQIITIRLGTGRNADLKTCTMSVFDSQTATLFADYTDEREKERAMRQRAIEQTHVADYQNLRTQSCMDPEPHHGEMRYEGHSQTSRN
jgi:hypothetical protein